MSKFTPWFSIDNDGNPARDGWYQVRYEWELNSDPLDSDCHRYFYEGEWFLDSDRSETQFGRGDTTGERSRGLAYDPSEALN